MHEQPAWQGMFACSSCLKKGRWVVDRSDRFGRGGTRTAIGGCILERRDRKLNHYDLPTKWVQLHEVCRAKMDARFFISVRNLPHDLCPKTATLRFDHDREIQATEETRRCYPLA